MNKGYRERMDEQRQRWIALCEKRIQEYEQILRELETSQRSLADRYSEDMAKARYNVRYAKRGLEEQRNYLKA